jgi:hypothetical protein
MGRDLVPPAPPETADRPEALSLCPYRVGPPRNDLLDHVGQRVRRAVHIGVGVGALLALLAHDDVTHRAADQIEAMAASGEELGEACHLFHERTNAFRYHAGRG